MHADIARILSLLLECSVGMHGACHGTAVRQRVRTSTYVYTHFGLLKAKTSWHGASSLQIPCGIKYMSQ